MTNLPRGGLAPRQSDVPHRGPDYNSSSGSAVSGNFGRLRRLRIQTRPKTTAANTTTIKAHDSNPRPNTPCVTATSWIEGVAVCAATTVVAWDFVSNPAASP